MHIRTHTGEKPHLVSERTEFEADFSEKDTYDACQKDGTEGITQQSPLVFDSGRIDPVEFHQQAGVGLGTEQQAHCSPQE